MNYSTQITIFVFLFTFVAQTFSKQLVVIDYYLNNAEFAKGCVNKKKPTMHCNGKCQMTKKIQKDIDKEQQNGETKFYNEYVVLFFNTFPRYITLNSLIQKQKKYRNFSSLKPTDRSSEIFHPPSFIMYA